MRGEDVRECTKAFATGIAAEPVSIPVRDSVVAKEQQTLLGYDKTAAVSIGSLSVVNLPGERGQANPFVDGDTDRTMGGCAKACTCACAAPD
mmetsp:Transcript_47138/g.131559  ORF Transcript_47138/g.131559 Transcript_47138/m.131559 type:complete len:92 (-) Transcript_47138:3013-3288(-)